MGGCAAIAVSLRSSVGHPPPSLASFLDSHRRAGLAMAFYYIITSFVALMGMETINSDVLIFLLLLPLLGLLFLHDLSVYIEAGTD